MAGVSGSTVTDVRGKVKISKILASALIMVSASVVTTSPAQAEPRAVLKGSLAAPRGFKATGFYIVDTAKDTVYLSVSAGALKAGNCATIYVDVTRQANVPKKSNTHFDIYFVRTCRAHTQRYSGTQNEKKLSKINVTGVGKVAICEGKLNTLGSCHIYKSSLEQFKKVSPAGSTRNHCARSWTKASNDKNFYFTGGNRFSCQK